MIWQTNQIQKQSSEESQSNQQKPDTALIKNQSTKCCSENRIYQSILCTLIFAFAYTLFFRIQKQYSYNFSVSPRVNLQQPKIQQYQLKVWKIINHNNANPRNQNCVLMNAASAVTQLTLKSIKSILEQQQISVMYVVVDKHDIKGNYLIQKNIKNEKKPLHINFDSDYTFFKSLKNDCHKLGYLFGNFEIDSQMASNLKQQFKELDSSSLYFTSMYRTSMKRAQVLEDLSVTDLSKKKPEDFYSYLYILNTQFFDLISPLNFVFYSKYTLEQMIIIPNLVLYQSLGKIMTSKRILYTLEKKYQFTKFKQFKLEQPEKKSNSICFVSYPNDPFIINETYLQSYMSSVNLQSKISNNGDNISLSVVIYFPYKFNQTTQLFRVATYLKSIGDLNKELNIKMRIINQKAVSSYAVYDSVYNYCPLSSLIVSSRHNVVFNQKMATELLESVTQKYHYYFIDLEFQNRSVIDFNYYFFYKRQSKLKWKIFEEKAHYIQIFKSDLMKTGAFWLLKSAQVDFYETEEVFFIHMMQLIRSQYGYIDSVLAKVTPRKFTEVQLRQIKAIKTYGQYAPLIFNYLMPYLHNCLQNPVYRRNSPKKMPAIIHQIWISNNPISQIRYKLRSTLIQKNPNFNVYLWTIKNITRTQAPLTFPLVERVLLRHKEHQKSLYAMAADILRYELLVSYGGIYIDFKYEGLKPLDNFLKYEVIFTDCDLGTIRLGIPKAVGNPIIGSTQNNYHLKIVLTELIREEEFQFGIFFSIPEVTGAFVLRQSISYKQLFTQVGFGYHFFIPEPYQKIVNLCGGTDKEFDKDQQVFEVDYVESDLPIKLGIPCKEYPQAYIVDYSPLGRTWIFKKNK